MGKDREALLKRARIAETGAHLSDGYVRRAYSRHWRMRAEEFRTKADNCELERTKRALNKVAATYEALAGRAERIRTVADAAE